jgi:peptide/nickel transport system permease protein
MLQYLVRRVLLGILTLLLISFVVYALVRHIPGTPLTADPAMMNPSKMPSAAEIKRLNHLYGLDKPWYEAYFIWLRNVLQLDFGQSIPNNNRAVLSLIGERLPRTLMLSATSLLLTYLLSIPLGLWATVRSGTKAEQSVSTALYMLYSLPEFVAALYLQLVFYTKLGWLPLYGMTSDSYETLSAAGKTVDLFKHALLPITCFTYASLAYYSRFIHANMQEVIRQDYIRTARAKGVPPWRVIWHHAFRNTLIPLVTLIGLTLPALLSGAVILEQIFSWPGIGQLFFESIGKRDYETIMALTLMFSVLTLVGQLLADVLYAVVDPRVSYS